MPPEQQTEEGALRRDSLASRRGSLVSRRDSLVSRRESLKTSFSGLTSEEDKILENGSTSEGGQVTENDAEISPEPLPEPEPQPLSPEEEKRLREEEEQIRKKIAIEMRKAELRAKMEEASKARRAKKGFMTPERKKKLRLLLRKKAAEELRKEQERKANERRWVIEERCGEPEDLQWASKDDLIDICEDYFQRIIEIESDKWDLEFELRRQTHEIAELTQKVSDLRGKFQRPVLKKVSKYENKFAKLQRKAAEYNFRSQLKIVRRPDYKPKEEEKKSHNGKITEENEITEKGEETEETTEDVSEGEDRSSVKEEDASDRSKVEEYLEIAEGGVEIEDYIKAVYTGRVEGSRLEKETPARADSEAEEDAAPEGVREGGQSPMVQGEVQPSELSEGLEPPHPPQPQHSPDDLWDFLKESVTGEHPATVEEFVQKLIGTLEHVPEEYLKPVIEYNIKRANSPSVTDGEHLELKEEDQQLQGEGQAAEDSGAGEANPREPEVAQEGEDLSTLPGQEKSAFERDEIPPEDPTDFHNETSYPEERSVTPEEYSALEATS